MFKKSMETKGHGSIRKTKAYGAVAVLSLFGALAVVNGQEVSANEIPTTGDGVTTEASDTSLASQATNTTANPATNLETAQPTPTTEEIALQEQSGTNTGAIVTTIETPTLDTTVEQAQSEGVVVNEESTVIHETLEEAQKDVEAQIAAIEQAEEIKVENNQEIAQAEATNAQIKADNDAEIARVAQENKAIDERNKAGQEAVDSQNVEGQKIVDSQNKLASEQYKQALEAYNSALAQKSTIDEENKAITEKNLENQMAVDSYNKNAMESKKLVWTGDYATDKATVDAFNLSQQQQQETFEASKITGSNVYASDELFFSGTQPSATKKGSDWLASLDVTAVSTLQDVEGVELSWKPGSTKVQAGKNLTLMTAEEYTATGQKLPTTNLNWDGGGVLVSTTQPTINNNTEVYSGDFTIKNAGVTSSETNVDLYIEYDAIRSLADKSSIPPTLTVSYNEANIFTFDYIGQYLPNFKTIEVRDSNSGEKLNVIISGIVVDVDASQGSEIKGNKASSFINPEGSQLIVESDNSFFSGDLRNVINIDDSPEGTYIYAVAGDTFSYQHGMGMGWRDKWISGEGFTEQNGVVYVNDGRYTEFSLFGKSWGIPQTTLPRISLKEFVPEPLKPEVPVPNEPPVPETFVYTPLVFTPEEHISAILKPYVEVPDEKEVVVSVHPVAVKDMPFITKDVVNANNTDVDNQLVAKGSEVTWVLNGATLKAGREELTEVVYTDPFPQGFEINTEKVGELNRDFFISYDENGKARAVASPNLLMQINADRTKDFVLPDFFAVGTPTNDGGTYRNAYELSFTTKTGKTYRTTSDIPVIYTPGNDPKTPRDNDGENPTPNDNLITPEKKVIDADGRDVNGKSLTPNSTVNYIATQDFDQYKGIQATKSTIAKNFAYIENPLKGLDASSMVVNSITAGGKDISNLLDMYHVLSVDTLDEKLKEIVKESGVSPIGEFYMWVAKNPQDFFAQYVQKGIDVVYNLSFHTTANYTGEVENQTFQIDFGNGYYGNIVENYIPVLNSVKSVEQNGTDINGGIVHLGDNATYKIAGWVIPADRGYDLNTYVFVDDFNETSDEQRAFKVEVNGVEVDRSNLVTTYNAQTGLFETGFTKAYLDTLVRGKDYAPVLSVTIKRIASGTTTNTAKVVYTTEEDPKTPKDTPTNEVVTKTPDGKVIVHYIEKGTGKVLKDDVLDTPVTRLYTPYDTTDNKPERIVTSDKKTYRIVPLETIGIEKGTVEKELTEVTYVYEEVFGNVLVRYQDEQGNPLIKDPVVDTPWVSTGTPYDTTDNKPKTIVTDDKKTWDIIPSKTKGNETGEVVEGTTEIIYVYKEVKGTVVVDYKDEDGNVIRDRVVDTPESSTGTPYNTTDNKPNAIKSGDKIYNIVPSKTIGNESGEVVRGETLVTYIYKVVEAEPVKVGTSESGANVEGKVLLAGSTINYEVSIDNDQFKGIVGLTEEDLNTPLIVIEDHDDKTTPVTEAVRVVLASDKTKTKAQSGFTTTLYTSLEEAPKVIQDYIVANNITVNGRFSATVSDDAVAYNTNYVLTGTNLTLIFPAKINEDVKDASEIKNTAYQLDFSGSHVTNVVTNTTPEIDPQKDVTFTIEEGMTDKNSLDGKEVAVGDVINFELKSSYYPANRAEPITELAFVDTWSDLVSYNGSYKFFATTDLLLKDGTTIVEGTDITKYVTQVINYEDRTVRYALDSDFLGAIALESPLQVAGYMQVTVEENGTVENTFVEIVNGVENFSNTVTVEVPTPPVPEKPEEPAQPTPPTPETPVTPASVVPTLPNTGEETSSLAMAGMALLVGMGAAYGVSKRRRRSLK
ncbi:TPA: SspB-related isopeptide-forming adhesin [Streptococcus suis]